jgi:hypothetical protein
MTAAHLQEMCIECGHETDMTLLQAQRILWSVQQTAANQDDRAAVVNQQWSFRWRFERSEATLSEDEFLSFVYNGGAAAAAAAAADTTAQHHQQQQQLSSSSPHKDGEE